jgi:hypothetical protein
MAPNASWAVYEVFNQNPGILRPYDEHSDLEFCRKVAQKLNPSGDPNGWGLVSKTTGSNVNGYASDLLMWGETYELIDIVGGGGGPNPSPTWIYLGPWSGPGREWRNPFTGGGGNSPPPSGGGGGGGEGGSGGSTGGGSSTGALGGGMPHMPSGLRKEAYQVAVIVDQRIKALKQIPTGRFDKEGNEIMLPDYQVAGTQMAVTAIAAVAADWAIRLGERLAKGENGKGDSQGEAETLNGLMARIFH